MGTRTRKAGVGARTLLIAIAGLLAMASPAAANGRTYGGGNAVMTTINYTADSGNHCDNGNPNATVVVNCNSYAAKKYVWFNGGPNSADVFSHGDGYYFFVVMEPGGKSGSYNDGTPVTTDANLSDDVDPYTKRTFHVTNGVIDQTFGHTLAYDDEAKAWKLNVAPYSTTSNGGGVYQLDVCWLSRDDPTANYPITNTSDCAKSDNFKTGDDETPPECPAVKFSVDADGNHIATQDFRDTGGLEKLEIVDMTNVNFAVYPPDLDYNDFPTGTVGWVTLIATQISKGAFTQAQILAWDVAGNSTPCDPVMTRLKVRRHHRRVVQSFRVSRHENKVVIKNGRPGLRRLRISVNGHGATLHLRSGQRRVLRIGELLTRKHNRVVLKGYGRRGGRAHITVAH